MPNGRLLILDDDTSIGQVIRALAEGFGLAVEFTTRPADFFRLVADWSPTHIALDLMMPEMDGIQVLGNLARSGCSARIIITSGVGGRVLDSARRAAAENGLDVAGVLAKPFRADALRALLNAAPAGGVATRRQLPSRPIPAAEPSDAELRLALERGELAVAFQPKVRCTDGALAGFEALVRWHRGREVILPDRFLPLAERSGLVGALTEVVLRDALGWMATQFPTSDFTVSVNLSARNLGAPGLADRIGELCRQSGLAAERVILELTESSAMEDPVQSLELLTRLRVMGFHLAIDDFGTGYSSMMQLVRLPFSEIKVDKSFVMAALRSEESRAVVKSVVDLGHGLGLKVTAEGVEDLATLAFLRQISCDLAQGYLIARPMPGPDALAWASRWTGLPV